MGLNLRMDFSGWTSFFAARPPLLRPELSFSRLDSSQSRMDMTNAHITKEEENKVSIEVRDQHPSKS
ncbi:hypothetical protein Tco_1424137, partial [Tanacetum coccineum]